jgi:streptogramin lyase
MTDYVYVAGNRNSSVTLRKYDTSGNEITTGWPKDHGANGQGVCQDNSGNVLFIGNRTSSITHRKYNDGGTEQWSGDYGTTPQGIFSDINDNVYVCGLRTGTACVRKYNSSGSLQWSADHGAALRALTVGGDGAVYVVGDLSSSVTLRKLSPSGAELWTANHGDTLNCVTLDSDGNVYVGGLSSAGSSNYSLRKYNSSGSLQWSINTGTGKRVQGMAVSSDGYLYIAQDGTSDNLRKYQLDGTEITTGWRISWGNEARGVSCDTSGNIYFCGAVVSSNSLKKYNGSGSLQWSAAFGALATGIWVTHPLPAPTTTTTNAPAAQLPLRVALPNPYRRLVVSGLQLPLRVGLPSTTPAPQPPAPTQDKQVVYRLYLTGGPALISYPISQIQCNRALGASTWLTVKIPTYTAADYALITSAQREIVIYSGDTDAGEFLRAIMTEAEYDVSVGSGIILLRGRVQTPSYSAQSWVLSGVSNRGKSKNKRTVSCAVDPRIRPNDTVDDGLYQFVCGSADYTIGPNESEMRIKEA